MMFKTYLGLCVFILMALDLFMFSIAAAQVPANDSCAAATVIPSLPYSTTQNTRLATPDTNDPVLSCADGGGGKTIWFVWTADTTGYIKFSSLGSTPANYDVALALFTGSCGSLVEVRCNDDAEGTRQSVLYYEVQSGTTYYLHVAEWKGGGPSGDVPTGGDLILNILPENPPPTIRGPKSGSGDSAVTVTTDDFSAMVNMLKQRQRRTPPEHAPIPLGIAPKIGTKPTAPEGSNFFEDTAEPFAPFPPVSRPVVLKKFEGIPDLGVTIPPDPINAAGLDHVMACVNSRFRIWDKDGTILKTIDADDWFATTIANPGPFDPKIKYDHFSDRWIMVWLDFGSGNTAYFLISVSDDADPLGTWYNWAIPSHALGDSVVSNWADYEGVGFDDQALYITSNQFGFSPTTFQYVRVRIVPKSELYANTGGALTWTDFWDLRDPDDASTRVFGTRPSVHYGSPGKAFLVNHAPYSTGTFISLWSIMDPLGSPSITGVNVPVVTYLPAPNANQLGGSLVEAGGANIRNEPVFRDSSLWVVHSVAMATNNTYSNVRYVRINPFTATALEDVAFGQEGQWYSYPAISVDHEKNVVLTYSRSSTTEYIGAYLSGRRDTDPAGLSPSVLLKAGEANYFKDFGSGRNRWGDYNGIALDPSDSSSFWAFTEYAESPANTWGTYVGKVKMGPLPGAFIDADPTSLVFGTHEVGVTSDTMSFTITNNGLDTLEIASITLPDSHFALLSSPSLPLSIATFESETLEVVFAPEAYGSLNGSILIGSNDTVNPTISINLSGTGFVVTPVAPSTMYATSGALRTVDVSTGSTNSVGPTGYTQVVSVRVHPFTHELIGLVPSGLNALLVRINSAGGDAHPVSTIPIIALKGMTFKDDTLYIGRFNGAVYRVDLATGSATQIASTGINIAGLDFNPWTNELWASVRPTSPTGAGNIYKINLTTGVATLVGSTGLGVPTQDIVFDGIGNLYGLIGTSPTQSSLIQIDTSTGAATVIGSMGVVGLQALAMLPDSLVAIRAFGIVGVDSTKVDSVIVTNLGGTKLTIDSVISTNPSQFSVDPTSASIPPLGSQTFALSFTPTSAGGKTGVMVFSYDPPARRGVVVVSGFGGVPTTAQVNVNARWNIVSVPVLVNDYRKDALFPTSITDAFAYYGTYEAKETLSNGPGFWLKFGGSEKVSIDGFVTTSETVQVQSNWNLIGSVTNPILASSVVAQGTAIMSLFYEYDAGYSASDSIKPGKGYWVKVNSAGRLILSSGGGFENLDPHKLSASSLSDYNSLMVEDARGYKQTLYFGEQSVSKRSLEFYELPPSAPAGLFDARFKSGRMLEVVEDGETKEFPILVTSAYYPLKVSWEAKEAAVLASLDVGDNEHVMKDKGSLDISTPQADIVLRLSSIRTVPTEFSLEQNYPNPFNPITVIRYQLPVNSKVTLKVYNLFGQEVKALVDEIQDAGFKSVQWNAAGFSSGVYFYRLTAGSYTNVQKMLLIK
ncbi:MAG: choice-of-anchor D domain-containing protein [Ignavibacteriae bacterium]|nr:choice-of-anchor D domain-containing protein [Ignavibacteriota bacterium]